MRRGRFSVMALAVAVTAAGCGSGGSGGGSGGSGGGSGGSNGSGTAVAFVLSGPIGQNPFLQGIQAGFQKATSQFGYKGSFVQSADLQAISSNIKSFAAAGDPLVMANSFESVDGLTAAAKAFPDTKFAIIDTTVPGANVRSATFKEYESTFLVGVEAAHLSKSGVVGFEGAQDLPLVKKYSGGLQQGIAYANAHDGTHARVVIQFTGSFEDVAKGKQVALAEISQGADVIYPAAGAGITGAFQACQAKMVPCIGVDNNTVGQNPYVVDASLKHTDTATYDTVKAFHDKVTNWGTEISYGLKDGGVGLASLDEPSPVSDKALGPVLLAELKQLAGEISSGKLVVTDPSAGQ